MSRRKHLFLSFGELRENITVDARKPFEKQDRERQVDQPQQSRGLLDRGKKGMGENLHKFFTS